MMPLDGKYEASGSLRSRHIQEPYEAQGQSDTLHVKCTACVRGQQFDSVRWLALHAFFHQPRGSMPLKDWTDTCWSRLIRLRRCASGVCRTVPSCQVLFLRFFNARDWGALHFNDTVVYRREGLSGNSGVLLVSLVALLCAAQEPRGNWLGRG